MDEKEENIIENPTQNQNNIATDTPIETSIESSVETQQSEPHSENASTVETVETDKPGMSIASMVLGIVSLVFWANWLVSVICAILALVFGIIRMKKPVGKAMAITGFITGLISLVWWGAILGFAFLGIAFLFSI